MTLEIIIVYVIGVEIGDNYSIFNRRILKNMERWTCGHGTEAINSYYLRHYHFITRIERHIKQARNLKKCGKFITITKRKKNVYMNCDDCADCIRKLEKSSYIIRSLPI